MISFGGAQRKLRTDHVATRPHTYSEGDRSVEVNNTNTQQKYSNTENILCFSAQAMGVGLHVYL